jgi:hypothetical protein
MGLFIFGFLLGSATGFIVTVLIVAHNREGDE